MSIIDMSQVFQKGTYNVRGLNALNTSDSLTTFDDNGMSTASEQPSRHQSS